MTRTRGRDYWNRRGENGHLCAVLDASLPDAANRAYSRWASPALAGDHPGPWLDVGCGLGRVLTEIGDGRRRIGLDLSETMLRRAQGSVPDVSLVQADAGYLPLRDAAFPRVVCMELLLHLPSGTRRRTLLELARVLAPGGRLLVSTNNVESLRRRMDRGRSDGGYHREWTSLDEVREHLEGAGLRLVAVRCDPFQTLLSLPSTVPFLARVYALLGRRLPSVLAGPFRLASGLDRRCPFVLPFRRLAAHFLALFERPAGPPGTGDAAGSPWTSRG